uniref:Uncharacterized protein n=1 Tax=Takifugu rubripes TaxID=31033 RepID=A0A3B5JVV4_TAKRU
KRILTLSRDEAICLLTLPFLHTPQAVSLCIYSLSLSTFSGSCLLLSPCSAISISLRPKWACLMLLMQKSEKPVEAFWFCSLGEDSLPELSLHAGRQN